MKLTKRLLFNSIMVRFTIWYIVNLVVVMIIIGSIVLISAAYFLMNNVKQDVNFLQKQMTDAAHDKNADWTDDIDNFLYPNYGNYYVKVVDTKGHVVALSHGWDKIIHSHHAKIGHHWMVQLLLGKGKGYYYTETIPWTQSHHKKGSITIMTQLNHLGGFLNALTRVIIFTIVIGTIIGSITIYFLTKRNIRPLKKVTDTVSQINGFSDFKKRVPVPRDGPHEITTLANAFNALLSSIEGQIEKERAFVSNASHELRTPVTAFKGHINLLKRWGSKDPEVLEKSIAALDTEGLRMERLINQLLILARTTSPYLKRSQINLGKVVQDSENELIHSFGAKAKIKNNIAPNVTILGIPDQIRQVAIILIENAFKYTNEEEPIEISVYQNNSFGILEVKDQGIGIAEEDLSKIFQRFYRVDKARSRKTGGSGLGLTIAKEIVESHNGRITVKSELGVGSTFTVHLPMTT